MIERLNRCVMRMQQLPKPIIGCINGVAVGAGCNLALATDIRIASDAAKFGEVFSRIGLVAGRRWNVFIAPLSGHSQSVGADHARRYHRSR